jgi:hypothetical protein
MQIFYEAVVVGGLGKVRQTSFDKVLDTLFAAGHLEQLVI